MQTPETVATVNSHLPCPQCHAAGTWAEAVRPKRRQNSTLHQLRCRQCGNRVAAKVSGGTQWREDHREQLENEYATLCSLSDAFSREEGGGVLQPLGYMESAGHGILVTQWFAGADLARSARRLDPDALEQSFRLAGSWLLQLHGADNKQRPGLQLGVAQKIKHLSQTYGEVLRTSPRAQEAFKLLATTGGGLEALTTRAVRIHGDFKPQNMLYDGTRCVGLDIHWGIVGAAVYAGVEILPGLLRTRTSQRAMRGICKRFGRVATITHTTIQRSLAHAIRFRSSAGVLAMSSHA